MINSPKISNELITPSVQRWSALSVDSTIMGHSAAVSPQDIAEYLRLSHSYGVAGVCISVRHVSGTLNGFFFDSSFAGTHICGASIGTLVSRESWVQKVESLVREGKIQSALKEISLFTTKYKGWNEYARISADLKEFDLINLPDIIVVALLRNTFSMRAQIPYWNKLLEEVEALLVSRGSDAELKLRGLK